jgi:AcrR family transcriptional regulator
MARQAAARRDLTVLPALQARSQRTRDLLLDAAEAVLRRGGPDAATVPAIAERAGVAVGSVYRRFPDKDAVLRSVYERFFEQSLTNNRQALAAVSLQQLPLRVVVPRLVDGMVHGYRAHGALLAGLLRYADGHPDAGFRKHAAALRGEALEGVTRLLLERREEIRHQDPETAVVFLLTTIGLMLKGVLLDGDRLVKSISWEHVGEELRTMAVRYLGLDA